MESKPNKKAYSAIVSKSLLRLSLTDLMDKNEKMALNVNIITVSDAN
jgi:hypothetical protein